MNWIFSKFLKDKATNTNIRHGNQNEFGGVISPNKPLAVVNEPLEFTSTVDFTNANVVGLSSEDSRPYKVYTALLTQSGTNAPTAIVLENTLGASISFSRENAGEYTAIASAPVFVENKTACFGTIVPNGDAIAMAGYIEEDTRVLFHSFGADGLFLEMATLAPSFFEIRVYN